MFAKTLAASFFAALALADSETFGLIIIRSGSQYQYSSISLHDGKFAIGNDNYVEGVITDDGHFKLTDGSYALVKDDGIYTSTEGSQTFKISGGYLEYDDSQAFSVEDDILYQGSSRGTTIVLRATLSSGSAASDFTPSGSSSSSSSSAAESTTTVVANSSNDTTPEISTYDNGAAAAFTGAGMGAVIAAAAALLI